MLEIPFNFNLLYTTIENSRRVGKMKINDEWSIVIPLKESMSFNSIEIHRKNTEREFFVSGVLKIREYNFQPLEKKFSQFIHIGSAFTEIYLEWSLTFNSSIWFQGFVRIPDVGEKQPVCLETEVSKLKIHLKSLEELSVDLERLLHPESSCTADVTLKCNGVSILAHKTILSARSSVFAAMFAHPMKESLKNEVDITDIDEPTLRDMLKYMYTGKTSDMTVDSAANLLFAADKYQLQDLKVVCVYFLKNAMSHQNVWKILVLGDMHSADLHSFAVDYISNNCKFSDIKNMQEWKELRKEKPDLAIDLLESLVKYREEK